MYVRVICYNIPNEMVAFDYVKFEVFTASVA